MGLTGFNPNPKPYTTEFQPADYTLLHSGLKSVDCIVLRRGVVQVQVALVLSCTSLWLPFYLGAQVLSAIVTGQLASNFQVTSSNFKPEVTLRREGSTSEGQWLPCGNVGQPPEADRLTPLAWPGLPALSCECPNSRQVRERPCRANPASRSSQPIQGYTGAPHGPLSFCQRISNEQVQDSCALWHLLNHAQLPSQVEAHTRLFTVKRKVCDSRPPPGAQECNRCVVRCH
jgi:hypothetical protein